MDAQSVQVRRVPISYSVEWIKASWRLAQKNYALALGIGLLLVVVNIILSKIPLFGPVLNTVISALLMVGEWHIVRKWLRNENAKFEDLFFAFSNTQKISKIIPYLVLQGILVLPAIYVGLFQKTQAMDTMAWICVSVATVATLISWTISTFAFPQILFHDKNLATSIPFAMEAFGKNLFSIFFGFVAFIFVVVLSLVCLVLPFIFLTIPLLVSIQYLIYASVFENLDLKLVAPTATEG